MDYVRDDSPSDSRPRPSSALPRALRPREKLFGRGPACLSLAELLALILGAGGRGGSARRMAERLIRKHGLEGLTGLRPRDWRAQEGVGETYAARMSAVFELGRRAYGAEEAGERPRINRPRSAFDQVRHLCRAKKEHLVGLYLDSQNGLLRRETISVGSLNTTRTHPREILFPAVVHLALGFILVHNHPSGILEPSDEDVEFTRAVRRAGELMGIELYDHLIIAGGRYLSLRERGVM